MRDTRGGARRSARPEPRRPLTAAEERAAQVRARRAERPERPAPARAESAPFEPEVWIDEGAVRDAALDATRRAEATSDVRSVRGRRVRMDLAPEVEAQLSDATTPERRERYRERLAVAADALDRGRFGDARRMVQPLLRDLPQVAFAHEIAGLAHYRLGEWRKAEAELTTAKDLDGNVAHLPVLADCARAQRHYDRVEQLWKELRAASPEAAVLAEGRIVAAGALADQGRLGDAISMMERAQPNAKRPREHHLRQWYVLADLYDRSGELLRARALFERILHHDPGFADVAERVRALGR